MPVTIRNATPEDIHQMLPLLEQLFAAEADFTFNADLQEKGLRLMLDGCGKHRAVKVACTEEQGVVGMCTAQTRISTAQGKISAVIEDLVVDAAWQGSGIGSRLVNAIEDWARDRGISVLQLLADRDNTNGLAFYKARDWQDTALICLVKPI